MKIDPSDIGKVFGEMLQSGPLIVISEEEREFDRKLAILDKMIQNNATEEELEIKAREICTPEELIKLDLEP